MTIPVGDRISIRTADAIDSGKANVGQTFRASLDAPLTSEGRVIVPAGAPATLQIQSVQAAGRIKGLERYLSIGSVLDDSRVEMVRQAKIPGVQLETRSVREVPGSGIGLSLVQEVARSHGGRLEVHSELNKGSKFTLLLPLT